MAFVHGHNLLADLLKAFGLEGRKGVCGLVLEVRVNEAARLHIEECIDTDQTPIDDIVGCLHRLTVERAEVDGRGCVTPVLQKLTCTQGTAEPHWRTPEELEDLRANYYRHLDKKLSMPHPKPGETVTPKELEALRAACQGIAEPYRRTPEGEHIRVRGDLPELTNDPATKWTMKKPRMSPGWTATRWT